MAESAQALADSAILTNWFQSKRKTPESVGIQVFFLVETTELESVTSRV